MPQDSLASAAATVSAADKSGENMAQGALSNDVFADIDLKAPSSPQSFLDQAQDIRRAGSGNPIVGSRFAKVERAGRKAADALDIIDQDYIDAELGKLPLEKMQAEARDLQASRMRVLPDILADPTITDYRAKVRIAGKVQAMFDSQISQVLDRKAELEEKAENRGKRKVQELKAKANIINKELETDKFLLTQEMARLQSGESTLQDMLEFASGMAERQQKADKAGDGNPFIGHAGTPFESWEISMFLKAEKNGGKLDISDSVSQSKREGYNMRYREWLDAGRPMSQVGIEDPVRGESRIETTYLDPGDPALRDPNAKYAPNPFPDPVNQDQTAQIIAEAMSSVIDSLDP